MKRYFSGLLLCMGTSLLIVTGVFAQAQTLKTAIKLTEGEQFDQAASQFKKLLQQSPNNGSYYFYYGENIMKSYLVDSANVSFKEVADSAYLLYKTGFAKDPQNPLNLIGMGDIELLPSAQQYFDQSLQLVRVKTTGNKPGVLTPADKAVVLMKMADAYIHSPFNDSTVTMTLLREAEKFDPRNPDIYIVHGDAYLASNDGNNANLMYNKAKELDPKSPKAIMRTGNLWYRNKAYLVALNYYQDATKIDSTFAPVYRELGKLYTLARQYDNAVAAYKKFLDLSANNISAKTRYAGVLISAKQYENAITLITGIIKEDSSRNDLNRALAYSYFETNQYDKGLVYITKFFRKTKPEKVIVSDWVYYGKLLARTKQDSLAVEKFQKAYALDTTNIDVLSEMASSCSRSKNYQAAIPVYEKILKKREPTHIDFYNLAKAYFGLKDYVKADSVLAIVNTMQPGYIPGLFLRASANANLDPETKEGRAKPYYEAIIEKIGTEPGKNTKELITSYEYLAYYYLKMKDYPKSKEYYTKVLSIDPANKNALDVLETLKKK
ncbi:MAG: tetratricopeptide repeat protein [Bacteroidetes bacterium]|nr:tetratricopeptide repeat protein [Bacteroidota bacterium]